MGINSESGPTVDEAGKKNCEGTVVAPGGWRKGGVGSYSPNWAIVGWKWWRPKAPGTSACKLPVPT